GGAGLHERQAGDTDAQSPSERAIDHSVNLIPSHAVVLCDQRYMGALAPTVSEASVEGQGLRSRHALGGRSRVRSGAWLRAVKAVTVPRGPLPRGGGLGWAHAQTSERTVSDSLCRCPHPDPPPREEGEQVSPAPPVRRRERRAGRDGA